MKQSEKSRIIKLLINVGSLIVNLKTGTVKFLDGLIYKEKSFWLDKDGYKYYTFRHKGNRFNIRGHRLTWIAANGEIPKNYDIDHQDKNRKNNGLENLRSVKRGINRGRKI